MGWPCWKFWTPFLQILRHLPPYKPPPPSQVPSTLFDFVFKTLLGFVWNSSALFSRRRKSLWEKVDGTYGEPPKRGGFSIYEVLEIYLPISNNQMASAFVTLFSPSPPITIACPGFKGQNVWPQRRDGSKNNQV